MVRMSQCCDRSDRREVKLGEQVSLSDTSSEHDIRTLDPLEGSPELQTSLKRGGPLEHQSVYSGARIPNSHFRNKFEAAVYSAILLATLVFPSSVVGTLKTDLVTIGSIPSSSRIECSAAQV